MKRLAALAVMGLALCGGCRPQSAEEEQEKKEKVRPNKEGGLGGYQTQVKQLRVKYGEPATLIASGDGASSLALYIFDRDGNCVAHDDVSSRATRDDLAVLWVPQRGNEYSYELVNLGPAENQVKVIERWASDAKEKEP